MNERIRELRTQAAAWVSENHQPQDPNAYSQKEIDQRYLMYEEKFAELIVRESMDLLEDFTNDIYLGGIEYVVVGASETLQEHFGIEE
jgi:hypothetical protein